MTASRQDGAKRAATAASDEARARLFDAGFLRKLERLELLARKQMRGLLRGEHTSRSRGQGQEFADFRRYQAGDDFRAIDWNIYQRLDRLFVRLYSSDQDLAVHLLLDCSASMAVGDPVKFDQARRLAAALAYVGVNNLERVGIEPFGNAPVRRLGTLRHRSQMISALDFLAGLECAGRTRLDLACRELAVTLRKPALVVVLSDLIDSVVPEHEGRAEPADSTRLEQGLKMLRARGHELLVLQILAEEEIAPTLDGAYELRDLEHDGLLKLSIDADLRARYLQRLEQWLAGNEAVCARLGVDYMRFSTAIPFEDMVLRYLRQGWHLR